MELSDEIRLARNGAVDNPYQGTDRKVLFVCSMGILRSATGSRIYAARYNTRSAGTYEEALIPLSLMLIQWADQVVFVNQLNYQQANARYEKWLDDKEVRVLNIPDIYPHMDPRVIQAFQEQYEPL